MIIRIKFLIILNQFIFIKIFSDVYFNVNNEKIIWKNSIDVKRWVTNSGYKIFKVLNGRSNSYLISTGKMNILVDTGNKSALNRLYRNINSLNLFPGNIGLLILTHLHFDHCGNAHSVKEKEHCKIFINEAEAKYALQGYTPLPAGTIGITKLISGIGKLIGKNWFGYKDFISDKKLIGNYYLKEYGLKIELIPTTGHSIGSISVIVDGEIAIVGDAMFGIFRNSIFPPYADNKMELIKSWKKLYETGCTTFLPGHGAEIKRELLQKEFIKYSQKYNINISGNSK